MKGSFGQLLRTYRTGAGLTQEELAERAALSVRAVRNLECGRTGKPYRRSAERLADELRLADQERTGFLAAADGGGHLRPRAGGVPAWPRPSGLVPRQLPPTTNGFVGRTAELAALDGLLAGAARPTGAAMVMAITGTPGVGKTALALHWAHRVAGSFPDGQLHVNLRGFDPAGAPVGPEQAIRRLLEVLGVPPEQVPTDPESQVTTYRSLLADQRMLVLLDNVRDAGQVRPLLPASPGSLVVVTSRNQLAGLAVTEGAHLITLNVLTDEDAGDLLSARLGTDRTSAEPAAAAELIGLCARLPLALAVAAARVAVRPGLPLAALAAELRDAHGRLDALDTGEPDGGVGAVFSWSFQHLSEAAARMFRLLGLHPGPDIPAAAAASLAAVPVTTASRLLNELTRTHLITEHAPGRYTFHDLLRAYAAEHAYRNDSENDRNTALHRMLDHYLHTAHAAALLQEPPRDRLVLAPAVAGVVPEGAADDAAAATWFAAEHAVLLGCVALAAQSGRVTHAWQLAWTLMTAFSRRGHCHDLETAFHWVLDAGRRADDLTAQAYAHRFLGRVGGLLGCHDEAYDHLHQALDLFERLGDLAGQAAAHLGLAREHELRSQPGPAVEHATRALELQRAAGSRIGEANGLNNLAWCYVRLGDYARALDYCRQALALLQAIGHRTGEACTWDTLGYVHHHLNQYAEAASCYDRALQLQRQLDDKYEQAGTLGRLGDAWAAAGNTPLAHGYWCQALAILEELHHPDAPQLRARLDDEHRS